MKQMKPGNARNFLTEHAHSETLQQIRLTFFPCIACLILHLLLLSVPVLAETIVSGEVSGVWDTDGSPYLVTDTLIVPEGETLSIQAGVLVLFLNQSDTVNYPLYVGGSLSAMGQEADSIRFLSQGAPFSGILQLPGSDSPDITLSRVVIQGAIVGIDVSDASVTVDHSRIHGALQCLEARGEGTVSMSYCSLFQIDPEDIALAHVVMQDGGPYEFHHNYGPNAKFFGNTSSGMEIYENDIKWCNMATSTVCEVYNNTFHRLDCSGDMNFIGTFSVHDNIIQGDPVDYGISAMDCEMDISNNTTDAIYFSHSTGEITGNRILGSGDGTRHGAIMLSYSDAIIRKNLIVSPEHGIYVNHPSEQNIVIIGNTIHFDDAGLHLGYMDIPECTIKDNIFLGDGFSCTGIEVTNGNPPDEVSFNCFHDIAVLSAGYDLNEAANMVTNPCLGGGDPFDYHLQANSPCIDAGDPESPDDPDGTRADIGYYYYDQSIDNPPVQTIPEEIFAQTGQLLRIQITATDDNGPFEFTFPDLPDWLSEEDELDWVGDTTAVSGTVPVDAEDFSFIVFVEDCEGQRDSSVVFVIVDHRTLLSGEISGILHVEDSPFYVIEDIIVPEGDSLVIEPGCKLQFRYVEDEEQKVGIFSRGVLIAEGTEQDSISFSMADNEATVEGWKGFILLGQSSMTSLSFIGLSFADWAIKADSSCSISLDNSKIVAFRLGLTGWHGCIVQVSSSLFLNREQDPGSTALSISQSSYLGIDSCYFKDLIVPPELAPIRVNGSSGIVSNCVFDGTGWISVDLQSSVQIHNNIFYGSNGYYGIGDANNATATICNNLFIGSDSLPGSGIITRSPADTIRNNVFYGLNNAIQIVENYDGGPSETIIEGNAFVSCGSSILDVSNDGLLSIHYNAFYENDSIDADLDIDETNLIVDPQFADSLFHLFNTSLLIDAGPPDQILNDQDSTRNDIGLWGGPYGASYEYPTGIYEEHGEFLPNSTVLYDPYPNPFNCQAVIRFSLKHRQKVQIRLFNILGEEVRTWNFPELDIGLHRVAIDGNGLSSGVYFLKLVTGKEVKSARLVLVR